jgi:hypothetical protein
VVHAGAVLCELIRENGIFLHVTRVGMAASAGVRHVDRVHRGTGIARPTVGDVFRHLDPEHRKQHYKLTKDSPRAVQVRIAQELLTQQQSLTNPNFNS